MTRLKQVYDLQLFEATEIGKYIITRIPGGFIYGTYDHKNKGFKNQVFVPYDKSEKDFEGMESPGELKLVRNITFKTEKPSIQYRITEKGNVSEWVNLFWHLHTNAEIECFIVFYFVLGNDDIYFTKIIGDAKTVKSKMITQNINLSFPEAEYILTVHNHPMGDTTFSSQDKGSAAIMQLYCYIHGIEVVDHIVTSNRNDYLSMFNMGIMGDMKSEAQRKLSEWKFITD